MAYGPNEEYKPSNWVDHVTDPEIIDPATGEAKVIREGTRLSAARLNNIEAGIVGNRKWLSSMDKDMKRLWVLMELWGRVPGSSGSFIDAFDGEPTRLTRLETKTDVTAAVEAGATTIPVSSTEGFTALTYVSIFDGTNYENVKITAVGSGQLTVAALTNGYSKGAKIARSTAAINAENNSLDFGTFTSFKVTVKEEV